MKWTCTACGRPGPRNKWDAVKNFTDWFFTRDGACYCPAHIPDWVAGWRRRHRAAEPIRTWRSSDG